MSKIDINAWRLATANAQKLNDEMIRFSDSRTIRLGRVLDKSYDSLLDDFSTYFLGSKGALEM